MPQIIPAAVAIYSVAKTVFDLGKKLWEFYDRNVAGVLAAIHYQELKKIHEIAFIVSESYRELWKGVYNEMSELSVAIGMESNAIATVFRNARSLVLNTSSTFGHPYDVAEIEWLAAMDSYLWVFNIRVKYYSDNPQWLFQDIDKHLNSKIHDQHANFSAKMLSNITRALFLGNEGIRRADSLSDDLTLFVNSLPNVISNQLKPFSDAIDRAIDDFIENTYEPTFGKMNEALEDLIKSRLSAKQAMERLTARLKNPGGFLKEIDNLSDIDRRLAEVLLEHYTSKQLDRDNAELQEYALPEYTEMERISNIEFETVPVAAWYVGEIVFPQHKGLGEPGVSTTWFIGEF